MNKKLTLLIDENLIENAKLYAKSKNSNLSKLISNYLKLITNEKDNSLKNIAPITNELKGIAKNNKNNIDWENDYTNFLMDKYK
jgi:hypothetical protein